MESELGRAALEIAASGMRILPCEPNGKKALINEWQYRATSNQAQVTKWWTRWPDANIGMLTGIHFDVVDIDNKISETTGEREGWKVYKAMKAAKLLGQSLMSYAYMQVATPSGGMHVYFKAYRDFYNGKPQSRHRLVGQSVDFQAYGGYVLLPPSTINGVKYEKVWPIKESDQNIVNWVYKAEDNKGISWEYFKRQFGWPEEKPARLKPLGAVFTVEQLAAYVRKQPEGNRNNCLHWAACRAYEEGLDIDPLIEAAADIGLTAEEITQTIDSASRERFHVA